MSDTIAIIIIFLLVGVGNSVALASAESLVVALLTGFVAMVSYCFMSLFIVGLYVEYKSYNG